MSGCVFCEIVADTAPATVIEQWAQAIAIRPLNPVTPGHTLIIPRVHVADAVERPNVTAMVMACACQFARRFSASNILTSVGQAATQSVFHLHVHVVPRVPGDGLLLPWSKEEKQMNEQDVEKKAVTLYAAGRDPQSFAVLQEWELLDEDDKQYWRDCVMNG